MKYDEDFSEGREPILESHSACLLIKLNSAELMNLFRHRERFLPLLIHKSFAATRVAIV